MVDRDRARIMAIENLRLKELISNASAGKWREVKG